MRYVQCRSPPADEMLTEDRASGRCICSTQMVGDIEVMTTVLAGLPLMTTDPARTEPHCRRATSGS